MSSKSSRKRTRRNRRSHGGAGADLNEAFADLKGDAGAKPAAPAAAPAQPPAAAQKGGRRKSRKLSKGAKAWTTAVTKLYREMKAKDKSAKFSDALKKASKLKKSGQL
jgi:hypothetical protein